ncbi:unnamed protein product, partial [marine sediment metagenome]
RRKKEKNKYTYMYVFSYVSIENYEKKLYIYKVLLKNSPNLMFSSFMKL